VKVKSLRIVGLTLAIAMFGGFAITALAERAAAQEKAAPPAVGQISGVVKDEEGKPMAGLTVIIEPQGGLEIELKTDEAGKFAKPGLPVGSYIITFKQEDRTLFKIRANVAAGKDTPANIGMSEQRVKDFQKQMKKELEEEKAAKAELAKAAAADKPDLQGKVEQSASKALAEYQQALAAVVDPADVKNKAAVYAQMATAYELEGKYEEAAQAYQQDVAARPDAGAYNNLGNNLAKLGKMDEARAAYDQSAALDPAGAPLAYRNFGVVLFNAGKMKDSPAVDLLKKATEAEPNNQQGWFLLGAALAANMEVEQAGEKINFKFPPGTSEAFQKCIDIDPKTPMADLARKNLDEYKSMGLGVDKKSSAPKVKH
jgi:tetratricopeptide (TPR) repeat protein